MRQLRVWCPIATTTTITADDATIVMGRGVIETVIFIIAPFSITVVFIVTTGITVSVRVAVFTRRPVFTETITGPRDPGTLETTVETRNKRYRDSHS